MGPAAFAALVVYARTAELPAHPALRARAPSRTIPLSPIALSLVSFCFAVPARAGHESVAAYGTTHGRIPPLQTAPCPRFLPIYRAAERASRIAGSGSFEVCWS